MRKSSASTIVNNGRFPNTGSYQFHTCLGTAADYPAQSGFEEGECISSDADWLSGRYIDTAFNNLLRNEEISLPSGNTQTVTDSNGKRYRGMVYVSPNTSRTATIWYWIKGEHDTCPKGNRQTGWPTGEGVTACAILIDPEGTINPSYSYSGHHGGEL